MQIQQNYPLSQLTTFRIGGPALYYAKVTNLEELKEALGYASERQLPVLILGGGSNMLVSDQGFKGLVIEIDFRGIEKIDEDHNFIKLKVASGENWDEFVVYA